MDIGLFLQMAVPSGAPAGPIGNPMDVGFFFFVFLRIAAGLCFLGAVALAVRLYLETDKGWYWLTLMLSIILLALSEWLTIILPKGMWESIRLIGLTSEICSIAGSILVMVSFYGMYNTMKDIRKRVD